MTGNVFIKDLNKLGRDLSKIIIVDNMPNNFKLQQENGIFIKSWIGDTKDLALKELVEMLVGMDYLEIAKNSGNDLRRAVKAAKEKAKKKDNDEALLNLSCDE